MNSASVFAGTDGCTRTKFTIRTGLATGQHVERKPRIERGIYGACSRDHEQPIAIGLRTDDCLGGDVAGDAGSPRSGLRRRWRRDMCPRASLSRAQLRTAAVYPHFARP